MQITINLKKEENIKHYGTNQITLDFEEYLCGVVGTELYSTWEIECFKAQAIAARTFALRYIRSNLIMDDTTAYQSFLYSRINLDKAQQATKETEGVVLYHNGSLIKAYYCSSNGGETKRCEEVWVEKLPYYTHKTDEWDTRGRSEIANVKIRHGIGFSQIGGAFAASIGITYDKILAFYYVGAEMVSNYGQRKEATAMNEKCQKVKKWSLSKVGCPYLYGGTGQKCTTTYRKARMKQYPEYASKMKANCLVLSGKQSSCNGCKYKDLCAYDCAQLTKYAMEEINIKLPSGANNQRNSNVWELWGDISNRPVGHLHLLYRISKNKAQHTGIGLDDETFIHAKGHDYGTVHEGYKTYMGWTEWRIPIGMYSTEEIEQIKKELNIATSVSELPIGKAVVTGSKKLFIRSSKSTTSKALGSFAKNASTDIYADDGIWVTLKYNGQTAYCMRQFMTVTKNGAETPSVTPVPTTPTPAQPIAKAMKVSGCKVPLNVRATPSLDGADIGNLAVGTTIIVLETKGDWAKFLHNGKEAWCSLKYLVSV